MARVKYDVRGVEGSRTILPAGVYNAKVAQADVTKPEGKDQRIELVLEVVDDKDHNGSKLFEYINLESEAAAWKLREFLEAAGVLKNGKGEAGTLDTAKILGTKMGVKTFVKPADDARGFDESARVRKMFAIDTDADESEDLSEDDEAMGEYDDMSLADLKAELTERGLSTKGKKPVLIARLMEDDEESDEEEEPEAEAEAEDEYTWAHLEALDRTGLKSLNKDEELGVKVTKSKDDDALRAEIAEALEIEVVEEEDEAEEEDEDEGPDDDYDDWTQDDLKEELEQRSLSVKGSKKLLVSRLRKDDAEEDKPF